MGAPIRPLISKELRELAAGRAFWVLLILLSLLVGTSFEQAVSLYGEASRAAAEVPQLAHGLSPFDGVLVPTFGALYLAATFLFPFVVIRTLGAEKQSGASMLMLQMPYTPSAMMGAKLAAMLVAWLAMALIPLSALLIWRLIGGHLAVGETTNLLLGHFLYAVVIAGIALLCAALTESSATAAILALAVTLGFWVLDFAAVGNGGALKTLAAFSLTGVLRGFERGVLSTAAVLTSLATAAGLVIIAGAWLHTGRRLTTKLLVAAIVVAGIGLTAFAASTSRATFDTTEDARNSFSPSDTAGLRQLTQPLTLIVRLAPEDPRLVDFERGVLGKLRRTVPRLSVAIASEGRSGLFESSDERYGEIVLRYGGREQTTRSTATGEVLPLIFELAGVSPPLLPTAAAYPGYPLVADASLARGWFFVVLPLLIAAGWLLASGRHTDWRKSWNKTLSR